mmetsp:Transcript_26679/g.68949  ORF Transcript_26679/g.68949 Transcript_26679/m.68949 type:complete len:261 (+) Transcript_26679:639-1421(+)
MMSVYCPAAAVDAPAVGDLPGDPGSAPVSRNRRTSASWMAAFLRSIKTAKRWVNMRNSWALRPALWCGPLSRRAVAIGSLRSRLSTRLLKSSTPMRSDSTCINLFASATPPGCAAPLSRQVPSNSAASPVTDARVPATPGRCPVWIRSMSAGRYTGLLANLLAAEKQPSNQVTRVVSKAQSRYSSSAPACEPSFHACKTHLVIAGNSCITVEKRVSAVSTLNGISTATCCTSGLLCTIVVMRCNAYHTRSNSAPASGGTP